MERPNLHPKVCNWASEKMQLKTLVDEVISERLVADDRGPHYVRRKTVYVESSKETEFKQG
jgi:hypothetical protein